MNLKIKYIIAFIVIIPALNLSYMASSSDTKMPSVTLADGYLVPSDDQGVIEPEIDGSFVQGDAFDAGLTPVNLEGISSQLATEIIEVEPQADGTSLVLLREYNSADAQEYDVQLYERSSLLHVDNNGVVIKSYNLGSGVAGPGMGAISASFTNSIDDINQYASSARLFKTATGYKVYYVKSDANMNYYGYSFILDEALDFDSIRPRLNPTGKYIDNPIAFHEYNPVSQTFETAEFALVEGVLNDQTSLKYQMFNLDVGITSEVSKNLELPTWQQMTGNEYIAGSKTLSSDLYVMPDRSFVGIVRATNDNIKYNGFVIWNEDGTIKAQYLPWYENEIRLLPELSTPEYIFFQENKNSLKKVNLQTGYMTLVKSYPSFTDLGIQPYTDSKLSSSYLYYGYVKNFRGLFSGYGPNPGAIIGLMDANFNVLSANVVPTDYPITMDIHGYGGIGLIAFGNLGEERNFANEPSLTTNSIGGHGWVDKTSGLSTVVKNDVYIGKMTLQDDYAPAIKVGDALIINKDEVGEQLTSKLMEAVLVYDSYDLDPSKQDNINLTEAEIYQKLYARINKSPHNLGGEIEWDNLGLDMSQIGYNQVKYFITDSNLHPTATSKIVNIIDNNTVIDASGNLALSAENIVLTLEQAMSLDTTQVLSLANATAWSLTDGQDLTNIIKIDQSQLSDINTNALPTVLPLELTLSAGDNNITKQIKVFIGGTYDQASDVILYGSGFNMELVHAKTLNREHVFQRAQIDAFYVTSGQTIDQDLLEVDLQPIISATEVGNYPLDVAITGVSKQLAVNLYGPTTELSDKEAIDAHNIIVTEQEISGLSNVQLQQLIQEKSYVKAWDLTTGMAIDYAIDMQNVERTAGVYTTTFTTENETEKAINVYVLVNPTCDDPTCDAKLTTMVIDAINFELEVAQVYTLTPIMVMQLSQATAYNADDNNSLKLQVDYRQVKPVPGSYEVTITTDLGLSKTVKAVVGEDVIIVPDPPDAESEVVSEEKSEVASEEKSEVASEEEDEVASEEEDEVASEVIKSEIVTKTQQPPKQSMAISAKDAFFSLDEMAILKEREELNAEIIKRSEARVWLVETNQTLSPLVVDSSAVEYKLNQEEPVEIETNYSTEQSLEILFERYGDNLELDMQDDEAIAAIDFGLTVQEVESLTSSEVKSLANSVAWNLGDMSNVEINTVDISAIKPQQGVYPVKFSTKSGTTLEVHAYVGQINRPKFTENGYVIFANNIELLETSKQVEPDLMDASNSVIVNQQTLAQEPVTFFQGNYDLRTPGVYSAKVGLDEEHHAIIEVTVASNTLKETQIPIKFFAILITLFLITGAITYFIFKSKRLG